MSIHPQISHSSTIVDMKAPGIVPINQHEIWQVHLKHYQITKNEASKPFPFDNYYKMEPVLFKELLEINLFLPRNSIMCM